MNIVRIITIILTALCCMPVFSLELEKHGRGSSRQIVEIGDPIESFHYTWDEDSQIEVVGLPQGVSYVVDEEARRVDISGTPACALGTYAFRVTVTNENGSSEKRGHFTIKKTLLFLSSDSFQSQTVEETDSIIDVIINTFDDVYISVENVPDGLFVEKCGSEIRIYGVPTQIGFSSLKITAERNDEFDEMSIDVEVLQDGLIKTGEGGSVQVVYVGDTIVPFGFRWECEGQINIEGQINGITCDVDSSSKIVQFYGKTEEIGTGFVKVSFESSHSVTSYEVHISTTERPTAYVELSEESGHTEQTLPYGAEIDTIRMYVYDADSVSVDGLCEGLSYDYNTETDLVSIYGVMISNESVEIVVSAWNYGTPSLSYIHFYAPPAITSKVGVNNVSNHSSNIYYDLYGRRITNTSVLKSGDIFIKDGVKTRIYK